MILSWGILGSGLAAEDILFNRLGVQDGLSSNEITCILKDRKGFMWLGTTSGVNRFDGYEFKHYKYKESGLPFREEHVSELQETADGRIWITYNTNQLCVYEPGNDRFIPEKEILDSLRLENPPAKIFVDNDKQLYFATYTNEFCRYDQARGKIYSYPLNKEDGRVCDMSDVGDRLYVVHTSGVVEGIDKASGEPVYRDEYLTQYANAQLFYVFADSDGDLWFFLNPGYSRGLFRLNPKSKEWKHYTTETSVALSSIMVRDVAEDMNGNIWIATDHGGINILDKRLNRMRYIRNNPFNQTSLSQNSVICLYRDDTGIMWAGTYKNGINYYHESIFKFQTIRYPLELMRDIFNNDFNCIVEDKEGDLWIGTSGNGLLRYDRETGEYVRYRAGRESENAISGDVVISMAKDLDGKLWLGTYMEGLTGFDGKRFKHYRDIPGSKDGLSNNSVYSLYVDAKNRLWIGTLEGGLDCLDQSTGKWTYYRMGDKENAINSDIVYSLSGDEKGNIVVGTSLGVNWINPETGAVTSFNGTKDGRSVFEDQIINVVFCDSRQWVWIGSNHGLHIYDRLNDKMYRLNHSSGLPDNSIMSILEDKYHTVWVGTKNGLLNIVPNRDTDNNYTFDWNSYDENEGVQGRVFNVNSACGLETGELAFGGTNGLTFVDPARIRYNSYAPPAVITGLMVNNVPITAREAYDGHVILDKDITCTKQLKLNYTERNFSFTISSCCYFLPLKNKYAFKMEGFDSEWTTVSALERRITYTNLNPGTYTFKVKAMNNDRIWSKEITSLQITILPPFWATGWAIALYIIAGILLAYGVIRFIFRIQQKKLEEEQERATVRQQHEVDEMKLRFFTNVSHEFRTPLTLIMTPLEKLMKTEKDMESQQILKLIYRNADRLLKLVNQLLDFRKIDMQGDSLVLSTGDIVPFVRDVAYSFKELSEQKRIHFSFSSVFTSLPMKFDTDKVFKIVSNLLSNAFKFTPENGKVAVRLSTLTKDDSRWIRFTVSNTGSMISAEHIRNIFDRFYKIDMHHAGSGIGLALVKAFVELHGGTISVESDEKQGTVFTVDLPVRTCEVSSLEDSSATSVSEVSPLNNAVPVEEEELEKNYDSSKPSVLIIDDNADIRLYVHGLLHADYAVIEAADGSEGIRKAMKYVPDLIISDVMMPGIDGVECCRRLKSELQTCHIPVILLTACSLDEQRIQGYDGGADSYISKPFSSQLLLARVRNLIDSHRRLKQFFGDGQALAKEDVCDMDKEFVEKFKALIDEKMGDSGLNVEDLGKDMGLSRVQLYRKIKSLTNYSPNELLRIARLKKAASLLASSDMTVSEIGYEVGFSSPSYFAKCYKELFGESPTDLLKRKG